MKLEIVTHCWHYSRALLYQLSSLLLHAPASTEVTVTVFASRDDANTVDVLEYFLALEKPSNVRIRAWWQPADQVRRRLTGRNLAALNSTADWVWFTDADYVFRGGALDQLDTLCSASSGVLLFPEVVQTNTCHAFGDELLIRANGKPQLRDIDTAMFTPREVSFAYGGVQIAKGDAVRQLGYCKDSRWQGRPAERWASTREDIWFRTALGSQGTPIALENVFRIRHSECGGAVTDGTDTAERPQYAQAEERFE